MIKFEFQNLLEAKRTGNGKFCVSGPMSPMMAAQEMVEKKLFPKLDALAFVNFENQEYNNWYEKGEGLTGCSTLLLVAYFNNCTTYAIVVDMGFALCPVAIWHSNDDAYDIIITKPYLNREWAKQLSLDDIHTILQQAEQTDLKPAGLPDRHKYKNYDILDYRNGVVETVSPKGSRYTVGLDDSKMSGHRTGEPATAEDAKKYIDWLASKE